MKTDKFGEFLVKKTHGRITDEHIVDALIIQKNMLDEPRKLGRILVDNLILSEVELKDLLKLYNEYKKEKEACAVS